MTRGANGTVCYLTTFPMDERHRQVMRDAGPALLLVLRSQDQAELLAWLFPHVGDEYGVSEPTAGLEVPVSNLIARSSPRGSGLDLQPPKAVEWRHHRPRGSMMESCCSSFLAALRTRCTG